MTHLLVDASNVFYRSRYAAQGSSDAGLGLHIVLNSIQKAWKLFQGSHVVFALDGQSWRKEIYPPYKAQRKIIREKKEDWQQEEEAMFFAAFRELEKFVRQYSNCTVLGHSILEADDLIGRWIDRHPDCRHIVVSGDGDFRQLLAPNVSLYDGIRREIITVEAITDEAGKPVLDKKTGEPKVPGTPEWLLFEKGIRGDSSDNIFSAYPRVLTRAIVNAFEDRERQGYLWNNLMLQSWKDHEGREHRVRDDFERNMMLIDLRAAPPEILALADATIEAATVPKRNSQIGVHFLRFCSKWSLNFILEAASRNSDEYIGFLKAPYRQ